MFCGGQGYRRLKLFRARVWKLLSEAVRGGSGVPPKLYQPISGGNKRGTRAALEDHCQVF